MELTELRYFYNVALSRSFSKGARLSHVSPPAISKAVKKLEEELGTRLFVRTTRMVSLTDAGELLVEHCRSLFHQVECLQKDIEEVGGVMRGEVRIGASEVFAAFLLPTAIARITAAHPGVIPRCFQLVPEQIAHGLTHGELDVGFTVGGEAFAGVDSMLIAESEGVLACGRSHPLFECGEVSSADLEAHPFVVPRHWQREYLTALDRFPEKGVKRHIGATTDRMSLAISLVVEGAFLGYFPQVTIGCQLRHDELKVMKGAPAAPPFRLEALTRSGARARATTGLVIEEVRRSVVETGGDPCGWTPSSDG